MRSLTGLTCIAAGLLGVGLLCPLAQARPGDLYIGNPGASNVVRIEHRTAHQSVVASGGDLASPDSGAFTKKGRLMIADYNALVDGAVFKINVKTGDVKTVASEGGFAGPTDVAIGPDGVFADDPFAGTGSLLRVDPDHSGVQTFVTQDDRLEGSYGMTLSANSKVAYVADDANSAIVRVKIATGAQRVVAQGKPLNGPTDVALGLDGKLYAVNNAGTHPKVIQIDRRTGDTRVFAKDGKLASPEGITIEPRR